MYCVYRVGEVAVEVISFKSANRSVSLQAKSIEQDKAQMLRMIMEDEDLQRKMFITAQQDQDKVYKVSNVQ